MNLLLLYLWQSPIIRLTLFWLALGAIGMSLFSWKVMQMRSELSQTLWESQSYIERIQEWNTSRSQKEEQITLQLERIERFRPNVPDLLTFVEKVEEIAAKRRVAMNLTTVQTADPSNNNVKSVTYMATITSALSTVQEVLKDLESLPFAITIDSLDISENQETFLMTIIFTLHTKFS